MADVVRAAGKHPFAYQAPTNGQIELIQHYRDALKGLHDSLVLRLPVSRERSLAITKLEEVSMWINKAIVFTVEASR